MGLGRGEKMLTADNLSRLVNTKSLTCEIKVFPSVGVTAHLPITDGVIKPDQHDLSTMTMTL